MRIARLDLGDTARVGIVEGDRVRLLDPALDVRDLLEDRPAAAETHETVPLASVRLLAPIEPPSIRDFLTFERHVEGMVRLHDPPRGIHPRWYEAPTFYFSNPHSVIGPYDDVPIPPGCRLFDYELEVAAVIGRDGRDVAPEQAHEYIAAYTIMNDWSARDLQFEEMAVGLGPAKGKDSAITLGPWLVTADELERHRRDGRLDLRMEVAVNGTLIGSDTLASMAWSFESLVAYASRGAWIRVGDVLGSGTCGGGCLAELWGRAGRREPPPLAVGDVVTMTVEGIGSIANRVVAGGEPVPVPRAERLDAKVD
ncbi:MAG: fumarylacetoacetate hydrolase family protein [Thermoleophilia bacterium]|nr:fumarylacetoacetate hydrolase family protein [Gaiellaceae bacterium]MDW8337766.1 fumarylacetoacetate hydrolase family protein [Thermoleophilia bacterium]